MNTTDLLTVALRRALAGGRPRVPEAGQLTWRWFSDLSRTRSGNGGGPNPISHVEIEAYARLYRWPLEPRHVDMILALDRAWMEWARTAATGAPATSAPERAFAQPINPQAFDAVFGNG